jgi:WD40 repeat protein
MLAGISRLCLFGLTFFGLATARLLAADDAPAPAIVANLKGHTETVYTVSFSPDGRYLLTGSFDKSLKLWEAATGKEIKNFAGQTGHQNLVLAAAFNPSGSMVASGAADNTAKLWDTPLSVPLREYLHGGAVNALALSPDGARLAGAVNDGSVKVWNVADGKQLFNLIGHKGPVLSVSFGGNGQFLASCGSDHTIRLWNPNNGQDLGIIGAHAGSANAVLASPNGNSLYSAGDDGLLKAWKVPVPAPRRLAAQSDVITLVVLANDGRTVVTAGADRNVQMINFDNGQPIRQWKGGAAPITTLGISNNKAVVAAGTSDGRLLLWNASDAKPIREIPAHSGTLTGIAFHPQNTQVMTAGKDGTLKLWNIAPGKKPAPEDNKPVKTIEAHKGGVAGIAFHGNGTQVLSGGADKTAKLWNVATGQSVRAYPALPDALSAVAFSRDYSQVGAAAGKIVKVWNTNDGKELLRLLHPGEVRCLSFGADRTKLATGCVDQRARIWDGTSGKELQFFSHTGPVHAVALSNNNTSLLSAGTENAAVVHAIAIVRAVPASAAPVRALGLAPGGQVLTGGDDRVVHLWNVNSGVSERTFVSSEGSVRAIAVARNGLLIATGGTDRNVRVYSLADAKLQGIFKTPGAVLSLAFNPNGQTLAAACDAKSTVTWNVIFRPGQAAAAEFGKAGQTFPQAGPVTGVTFAADNVTIFTASVDRSVKAWKLAADGPTKNFGHGNYVDAVAFNPAGTQLATGGHEGIIRIWDVAKGQQLRQINAHIAPPAPAPIYCLAYSPDGKQLVSGSYDRSLKLWDAASGALVKEFRAYKEKEFEKGHRDGVFCVAFSPDAKSIVSGSSDHAIKVWNVADGKVLRDYFNPKLKDNAAAPPSAHPGAVYSLRFTPDGGRVLSAGHAPRNRGYVAIWNAADGKLIYGKELELGNINSVAVSPDGKYFALACSPSGRNIQEANAYVLKMPLTDTRQTTRAEK